MKAKKFFIYIGLILMIILIYSIFSIIIKNRMLREYVENDVLPTTSKIINSPANVPSDDISLYEDTMAPNEVTLQDYPSRLMILNQNILLDTTLPTVAYYSLEEYITQYLDYYWNNGTNYYANIVDDSFVEDYNFPSFRIYIPDLDLEIKCEWYVARDTYHFYSRLNSDDTK